MLLTPHFALLEFTESAIAKKRGIDNSPSAEAVVNLMRLCQHTLEPLRETLGLPVIITSGYRCQRLNDTISHSSDHSQHMNGQAADFYVGKASREELIKTFREILQNPCIDFDQVILYPTFIHVSYVSKERNRHGILKAQGNGKLGYGRLTLQNALKIS